MKKALLSLIFCTISFCAFTQQRRSKVISLSQYTSMLEKPKVDTRVELLSIVFRLAGAEEYSSDSFKQYTDRIESHFGKFKDHELITFIQKIRNDDGIGYDAVMKMAIHLGPAPEFKPLVKFSDSIPEKRWKKANAMEFVRLLGRFYKDSNSEEFFKENIGLYSEVTTRFLPVYMHLDLKWYKDFYGKAPKEKFVIINGVGNGGGNYGPDIVFKNGRRDVYAIMGTWSTDSSGMAKFDLRDYFPTLLHEFNHSFVNYLTDQNLSKFKTNGGTIYNAVQSEMNNQAYGEWRTMISEAMVRAAVIKYMKDHKFDQSEIDTEIRDQVLRGFLWINELVAELEKYDSQRGKYPTLESYMPNIIAAYEIYAANIESYKAQLEAKRPKVVSINEFSNKSETVNPEIKSITINFDRPLFGKGYSINYGKKGAAAYPKFTGFEYSTDKKSVILKLELEKDKVYQFMLTGKSYRSADKIPIREYEVNFKTGN